MSILPQSHAESNLPIVRPVVRPLAMAEHVEGRSIPSLESLLDEFIDANALRGSRRQAKRNLSVLRRFFNAVGIREVGDIAVAIIEQYLAVGWKSGRSPHTLKNDLGSISAFCQFLFVRDYLRANPCKHVAHPRIEKRAPLFLTTRDVRRALKIARRHGIFCEVCLALNTGLRMSELRFLRWDDLNFRRRSLLVRKSKSKRPRTVWLNPAAIAALRNQRKKYRKMAYVFPGGHSRRAGLPVWDRDIARGENWWAKTALIPLQGRIAAFGGLPEHAVGRGWHLFRHTFASHAVQAGISLYKVSQWLGHAHMTTTQIYAHLAPNYDREIESIYGEKRKGKRKGVRR